MLTFPHACEALTSLGIDPDMVMAAGATEDGYISTVRHQDGTELPSESDTPRLYRVPWPSRDAWLKVREAIALDTVANGGTPDRLAEGIEAAADWLEARRDQTWNGGVRRPSNFGRAAAELRIYAAELREIDHG